MSRQPRGARPSRSSLLAAALLLAALTLLALPIPHFERLYGASLRPALTSVAAFATDYPLPLALPFAALAAVALAAALWRAPRRAALLASALVAGYVFHFGAAYRRAPLGEELALPRVGVGSVEVEALALELLESLRGRRPGPVDERGAVAAVAEELEELASELGWPATVPRRVKRLPDGALLATGYSGMAFPFTLEALVDGALPPLARVSVGAHELAHLAGFARESDAELAAVLASLRSAHEDARYAAALALLSRLLATLPPERSALLAADLPPHAARELAMARAVAGRYLRPSLSRGADALYDRFLRGQGVTGGIEDYGAVVTLAVRARAACLLPVGAPCEGTPAAPR